MPFDDYFWQKFCTLICLACVPERLPAFSHICELNLQQQLKHICSISVWVLQNFRITKLPQFSLHRSPTDPPTHRSLQTTWHDFCNGSCSWLWAEKGEQRQTSDCWQSMPLCPPSHPVTHPVSHLSPLPFPSQNSRTKLVNQFLSAQRHANLPGEMWVVGVGGGARIMAYLAITIAIASPVGRTFISAAQGHGQSFVAAPVRMS